MAESRSTKSGFIALVGAPNAGKSTFFNRVLGQKLAIVSPKAQTTRFAIRGILTEKDTQFIFVDTPGIHKPHSLFNKMMVEAAHAALTEADAVLMFLDATKGLNEEAENVLTNLKGAHQPVFLALNKVDKVGQKEKLLPLMKQLADKNIFQEIFAISALKGTGVADVLAKLAGYLPESPYLYDPETLTDLPNPMLAAEITREKAFLALQQELPYALLVETEQFEESTDKKGQAQVTIHQNLIVQREGQKKIVLGHHGAMVKKIGEQARKELEDLFGRKVHLFLKVKVRSKWEDNANLLANPLSE